VHPLAPEAKSFVILKPFFRTIRYSKALIDAYGYGPFAEDEQLLVDPLPRRARARAREVTGNQRPWPADKVERWQIDRLIPYAKNARTHTDAQVAAIAASKGVSLLLCAPTGRAAKRMTQATGLEDDHPPQPLLQNFPDTTLPRFWRRAAGCRHSSCLAANSTRLSSVQDDPRRNAGLAWPPRI